MYTYTCDACTEEIKTDYWNHPSHLKFEIAGKMWFFHEECEHLMDDIKMREIVNAINNLHSRLERHNM